VEENGWGGVWHQSLLMLCQLGQGKGGAGDSRKRTILRGNLWHVRENYGREDKRRKGILTGLNRGIFDSRCKANLFIDCSKSQTLLKGDKKSLFPFKIPKLGGGGTPRNVVPQLRRVGGREGGEPKGTKEPEGGEYGSRKVG